MDERSRRILEHLEQKGQGIYDNISPILSEIFGSVPPEENPKHTGRQVSGFLDELIESGVIRMRDRPDHELGKRTGAETVMWFNFQPIGAAITSTGLEKLTLERAKEAGSDMERSVLTTNASIERLNGIMIEEVPKQTMAMRRTAIYAAAAVIIALGALFKDFLYKADKQEELKLTETNKILQKQTQGIDSLNRNLHRIDSTLKNLRPASSKQ
jgi:hypothetical protein